MKSKNKKIFLSLLTIVILLHLGNTSLSSQAQLPTTIYETKDSTRLGSGIVHEHIKRYTTSGWMNINVLRVDMTNEHNQLKGLFNEKAIPNRDTVSNMVDKSGAVAGINGDYFNYSPLPSAMGTLISEGKLISSPIERAYALPTFYLNTKNEANVGYLDRKIIVTNQSRGNKIIVNTLNKVTPNFDTPTVLNSDWGPKSIGNRFHRDLVELVVENDRVVDLRIGQAPTNIPKNGYVVAGRGTRGQAIKNFKPGDKVHLEVNTTPDLESIEFAIGAGSIVLKDGQATLTNIHSSGLHPRTGIGANKDNTELILVTIDGRSSKFKGIGQKDFGALLKDLGAYNGVNLDGGGSTTMAVKPPNKDKSIVANYPSDNYERKVVNGVGVFSNAKRGVLEHIDINCSEPSMYVNTRRNIGVEGFDGHRKPVNIDRSKLEYSVSGVEGEFINNTFIARSPGRATITAKYGDFSDSMTIDVYDEAINILVRDLQDHTIRISPNSQYRLPAIYGHDRDARSIRLYPSDCEFILSHDIGEVRDNILYTKDNISNAYLTIKHGRGVENIKLLADSSQAMPEANIPQTSYYQDPLRGKPANEANPLLILTSYSPNFNPSLNNILQAEINRAPFAISLNGYGKNLLSGLTNEKGILDANKAYNAYYSDLGDVYMAFLNTKNKGINKSDIRQWHSLKNQVKNANQKNIIITSQTPLWGPQGFSNREEADMLHKVFLEMKSSGKNLYIVQQSNRYNSSIKDGIRYLELDTKSIKLHDDIKNLQLLEFYIKDDLLAYNFRKIFK